MKSNKHNKHVVKIARHSDSIIPSWVLFGTIIIATFALCISVIIRTRGESIKASAQYQKMETDLDSLRKNNVALKLELSRLLSDPRAIESAARKRLHMVKPNEEIALTDDSPETEAQGLEAKSQASKSSTLNNRWVSYLVLALYCGIAVVGGFIVVKSFIAILRYLSLRRGRLHSKLPLSSTVDVVKRNQTLSALSRLALLLFCGLILAAGFVFSAGQYFNAISIGYKSEDLKHEQKILIDQQLRLFLEREQLMSPERLEASARKLGLIPITPDMVQRMKQSGSNSVKKSLENVSVEATTESLPNNNVDVLTPQALKIVLIILALFGGTLAVVFSLPNLSELIIRGNSRGIRFERAPGSNYLSLAEFFYSPKAVEEIFKPIVADWRTEYFNALEQKRKWKARWISIRYHYRFIQVIGLSKVFSLIRIFKSASK